MRSDWSALSRHHNLTETLTATLPTLRYQHVTWTCYMITTDVGFHFLRSVSFFSLSASGSVIRVTLMRRLLIICAVKMLLCVYVPSVYVCVCVCACVRVIRVKCWCLATALHLLSAFTLTHTHTHTHTVWPAVTEMCSVSSWIDPEDNNTTATSNSTFPPWISASLLPIVTSAPFSLLSFFTFRGSGSLLSVFKYKLGPRPTVSLPKSLKQMQCTQRSSMSRDVHAGLSFSWCHVWLLKEISCQSSC